LIESIQDVVNSLQSYTILRVLLHIFLKKTQFNSNRQEYLHERFEASNGLIFIYSLCFWEKSAFFKKK